MGNAKITFGLKNLHYALLSYDEDGTAKYGTPKKLPGAVSISLSADGEKVEFYADDILYYSDNVNSGYTGDVELALVPDDFKSDVFGDEIIGGLIYENADANVKHVALLGEFDTDAVKKRFCLYDVLCARPEMSGKTKEKVKTPQTQKMSLTIRPIEINGRNIVKCTTCAETDKNKFEGFFAAVPLPAVSTPA